MNSRNDSVKNLSYSMVIDSRKKINIRRDRVFKKVEPRINYQWVDDTTVSNCYKCDVSFTMFSRKHHCRSCGKIFCYYCSTKKIVIRLTNKSKKPEYFSIYNYIPYAGESELERVCDSCHEKISALNKLCKIIKIFELAKLNLQDYYVIAQVNKTWNRVALHYFSVFREIQYKLPTDIFTNREKEILWINKNFLAGHSKWLAKLILSLDKTSKQKSDEVVRLLYKQRNCSCWTLMCGRSCKNTFTPEDSIICLPSTQNNVCIRKYLVSALEATTILELVCYLPFLVYNLRFSDNIENSPLPIFLIERAKKDKIILNYLYWELTCQSNCEKNGTKYLEIKNIILDSLRETQIKELKKGEKIILKITEKFHLKINKKIVRELEEFIEDENLEKDPIYLPINPVLKCKKMNIKMSKIKNSSNRPIIIPCQVDSRLRKNLEYKLMYKKEDVRKDQLIMNIITLMNKILKDEENLDLFITRYNILPINENEGFIEIITNASTIHDIKDKLKFSIQNFIIENSQNLPINQIRYRFMKSCAAYCVISYLLGFGDRHLENIMITKSGLLFHIDYGFILGQEPKYMAPEIRITPQMVDAMGGLQSKYYKKFKEICTKAYNCLRRHADLFVVMLSTLANATPPIDDGKFTISHIKDQVIKRFIPGENYDDAKLMFNSKVSESSITAYGNLTIDLWHGTGNTEIHLKDIDDKHKGLLSSAYDITNYIWKKS